MFMTKQSKRYTFQKYVLVLIFCIMARIMGFIPITILLRLYAIYVM